jgi:hypothetical protein
MHAKKGKAQGIPTIMPHTPGDLISSQAQNTCRLCKISLRNPTPLACPEILMNRQTIGEKHAQKTNLWPWRDVVLLQVVFLRNTWGLPANLLHVLRLWILRRHVASCFNPASVINVVQLRLGATIGMTICNCNHNAEKLA